MNKLNKMEESKIDSARIINDTEHIDSNINESIHRTNNSNLEISKLFYFFGLLLMLIAYVGPFLYFKYYKKKNFLPGSNVNVKHAI